MQPAPIEIPEGSVLGPTLLALFQTIYHLQFLQLKPIYCLTIQRYFVRQHGAAWGSSNTPTKQSTERALLMVS